MTYRYIFNVLINEQVNSRSEFYALLTCLLVLIRYAHSLHSNRVITHNLSRSATDSGGYLPGSYDDNLIRARLATCSTLD